jgi:hypothetical protein
MLTSTNRERFGQVDGDEWGVGFKSDGAGLIDVANGAERWLAHLVNRVCYTQRQPREQLVAMVEIKRLQVKMRLMKEHNEQTY